MYIISGTISAAIAYYLNKWVIRKTGNNGLIILIPMIEELSKTFIAVITKTSILSTHIVFGLIEAVYDLKTSSKKIGKMAALFSIISHSIFGFVTWQVYIKTEMILIAIVISWLIHSGWNWYITKRF